MYEDRIYPTVEHAFQAAKCINDEDKEKIRLIKSPAKAKFCGRRVPLRADWESQKIMVMENCLRAKFQDKTLRDQLISTKGMNLVEGNTWHDNQWGNCTCARRSCQASGKNILGKLLMKIRDEL